MLASRGDVANALGIDGEDDMTSSQQARVDGLLERVSSVVARESGRMFGDTFTVGRIVIDGRVYLPDAVVDEAVTVSDRCGAEVASETDAPGWIRVSRDGRPLPSGESVTVTFTAEQAPQSVVALVAAVVARHLTVEPDSPEAKAVELVAGPNRWRGADWASSTALLTGDELREVRAMRLRVPSFIVHRI